MAREMPGRLTLVLAATGLFGFAGAPKVTVRPRPLPPDAVRKAVVTVICLVKAGGYLTDCKVESESPPGGDFGGAALKQIELFPEDRKVDPAKFPSGSRARIAIRFSPVE